jgi:hypothetical protein
MTTLALIEYRLLLNSKLAKGMLKVRTSTLCLLNPVYKGGPKAKTIEPYKAMVCDSYSRPGQRRRIVAIE